MGKLFSIDGLMYRVGTTIIDLFYMNLLWVVFTLIGFGITGGASTSALFYVMLRRSEDKGNCNFKEFFYAFKKNLLKSTIVWIILILLFAISIVNIQYIPFFKSIIGNTFVTIFLFSFQLLVLIELIFISVYIFALLAQYNNGIIVSLKVAFILAHKHMFSTITCIALMAVVTIGLLHVPIILFAGISGYVMVTSWILKDKIK